MLTECTRRSGRAQRRGFPRACPTFDRLAHVRLRAHVERAASDRPDTLFSVCPASREGASLAEIGACGGRGNLLFLPQASTTTCRWAPFLLPGRCTRPGMTELDTRDRDGVRPTVLDGGTPTEKRSR